MSLFEIVVIVAAVVCIPVAAVVHFPVRKLIDQAGRRGALWFEHLDDVPVRDRPSEDARDAAIPRRTLRGRSRQPTRRAPDADT